MLLILTRAVARPPPVADPGVQLRELLADLKPQAPQRAEIIGNAIDMAVRLARYPPAKTVSRQFREVGQPRSDDNLRRLRLAIIGGRAGEVTAVVEQLTQTDIRRLADHGVDRAQIIREGVVVLLHPLRLVERIEAALQAPADFAPDHRGWSHQPANAIGRIVIHMMWRLGADPRFPISDWRDQPSLARILAGFFTILGVAGNARGVAEQLERTWKPPAETPNDEDDTGTSLGEGGSPKPMQTRNKVQDDP